MTVVNGNIDLNGNFCNNPKKVAIAFYDHFRFTTRVLIYSYFIASTGSEFAAR